MAVKSEALKNPHLAALLDLMQKNPHLPVLPMVDSEVVADDFCGYWLGSWGHARLDKYYSGEERVYFYDEHDMEDVLVEVKGWDWLETSNEEADLEAYQSLPWVKCIVVYIGTPEV